MPTKSERTRIRAAGRDSTRRKEHGLKTTGVALQKGDIEAGRKAGMARPITKGRKMPAIPGFDKKKKLEEAKAKDKANAKAKGSSKKDAPTDAPTLDTPAGEPKSKHAGPPTKAQAESQRRAVMKAKRAGMSKEEKKASRLKRKAKRGEAREKRSIGERTKRAATRVRQGITQEPKFAEASRSRTALEFKEGRSRAIRKDAREKIKSLRETKRTGREPRKTVPSIPGVPGFVTKGLDRGLEVLQKGGRALQAAAQTKGREPGTIESPLGDPRGQMSKLSKTEIQALIAKQRKAKQRNRRGGGLKTPKEKR